MNHRAVLFAVVIVVAIVIILLWINSEKQKKETQATMSITPPPRPINPPFSAPTWSARGDWAIPFAVRYAISFVGENGIEGMMSEWSPYYRSSQFSNPILSRFPVVTKAYPISHINIYRQFEGHQPILLDTLPYPYLNRYTDRTGDDA